MVYQEVASEEGTAAIIKLTGPNGSIALDIAGAEFLELETVEEEFQPVSTQEGAGSDGRRALGYKTIEKVCIQLTCDTILQSIAHCIPVTASCD
jgi:hypothetical protein